MTTSGPPANVHDAALSAFSKGTYSDLAIVCKDRSFKVHKVIVCTQSEFLSNAVKEGFKEAIEATIRLDDVKAMAVEAMLLYLYHGAYKLRDVNQSSEWPSDRSTWPQQLAVINVSDILSSHLDIYALADRMCLVPLRQLAAANFKAELHHQPFYRVSPKLSEIINKVNEVAPPDENGRSLRAVVAEVICRRLHELATKDGSVKLEHKMAEMAKYAADLECVTGEAGKIDTSGESSE